MDKIVLLVYFSGTGGVKLVADKFEKILGIRECKVIKHSLDIQEFIANKNNYGKLMEEIDQIILVYAVHAMDAPQPVYEWIDCIPEGIKLPIAVISVSGGGSVWPNTSCRVSVIKAVEKKGYYVDYEKMMVMPSNWISNGGDHAIMHVLNKMPEKVDSISDDILTGKKSRTGFKLSTRILMPLSKMEKKQTATFGKNLVTDNKCNGCGWCQNNCPRNNINLQDNKPVFGDHCIICLRCIYGCPNKSIIAKKGNFVVVKTGFDIKAVEKRMEGVTLEPVEKCCKGLLWLGVKRYLLDRD